MKKLIYIILGLAIVSCSDNFEEINKNNNDPTYSPPEFLLKTVIFNFADKMATEAYDLGEITAQYGGFYEYNALDIYNWGADGTFWAMYDYLEDLDDVKEKAILNENKNYEAIALVLESHIISTITDTYGYAPYSEALQAEDGIYKPKYDSQEEIYNQIFENLERANNIANSNDKVAGDILFNGNMDLWKKYANSLKVRLLLRVSNKKDVSAELSKIVNNPSDYPLINSNQENAAYIYGESAPNAAPFSQPRGARAYGYELIVPTTHLIENLKSFNNDPRLYDWIDAKVGTTDYIGLQPGLPLDQIGEPVEYAARAKSYFKSGSKAKSLFVTYSELNFNLSEAVARGLISGDAEEFYKKGVKANFEQWNLEIPNNYFDVAPYNAQNFEIQRWLANYHLGIEGWLNWKRTGKPDFIKPGPGAQINEVPRRLIYPTIGQSVNKENYNVAVNAMGGDKITTKVWWDKF